MRSIIGESIRTRAFWRFFSTAITGALFFVGTACIPIPERAGDPYLEVGIIDESTLDAQTGVSRMSVIETLGRPPDYVGQSDGYNVFVYEGRKSYETDLHLIGPSQLFSPTVDVGSTDIVYCYLLELDGNGIVRKHETIVGEPDGTPTRDNPNRKVGLVENCLEAVWESGEREAVLADTAAFHQTLRD